MKTPDLRWFLLISIGIHTLVLWQWSLTFLPALPPPTFKTYLLSGSMEPSPEKSSAPGGPVRPLQQGNPISRLQKPSEPASTKQVNPSTAPGETATASTGGSTSTTTEGASSPDGGTLSVGGSSSAAIGAGSGGIGGSSSGAQGQPSGKQGEIGGGGKVPSPPTQTSVASTPIPEPPEYRYRLYNGYYPEVDHYVLQGMNIPGTDLCIAGDQLRTRAPVTITQVKTDYSKCRIRTRADREIEFCPPEARSEVIVPLGFLASPLSYTVNTCREYDKSHCRVLGRGTDREREYCRVNFKYEGVWDAGTIFEYRCVNSASVTHKHPLEYNIRYMVEFFKNDHLVAKEVHRVKQTIPHCTGATY